MLYLRPFGRFLDPRQLLLLRVPLAYYTIQLIQKSLSNRFCIVT